MNDERISPLPEAAQHLEKAYALEKRDEFEQALEECEAAIRLDAGLAEAHNLRGIILEELGQKEQAILAYREAVRLAPGFREAEENLRDAEGELKLERPSGFRDLLVESTPWFFVTPVIIALNVVVFVIMVASGASLLDPQAEALIDWGASFGPLIVGGEWWRLLSAMFVHIGIFHLGLNMHALWRLGKLTERLFGNWAFLLLYVLSGLGAAIASLWLHADIISAGASGAIFGVAGGLAVFLHRGKLPVPREVTQNVLISTLLFVAYNLLYGFLGSGIDNAAHLGGLVTGAVVGALLVRPLPPVQTRLRLLRSLAAVGIVLILVAGTYLVKSEEGGPTADLSRARALLEAGEVDQAIAELESVLDEDPSLAIGHFMLGEAYRQKQLYGKAAASYTRAISLDSQFAEAYFSRGVAYAVMGRSEDSVTDFNQAIELGLDDGQVFLLRGLVYADLGERERAISDLERALELGLEPETADYAESVLQNLRE